MSRAITTALASIVAAARKKLPSTTGATEAADVRRNRPRRHVILADVSGSMAEPAAGRRKIDVLREALRSAGGSSDVVAFSTAAFFVPAGQTIPEPSGSTALHLALDACADATDILVISDGHPDLPADALTAAARLDARIDVIYCGPDNDAVGIEFMRRLARGGGAAYHRSLSQPHQIASDVRRLALPSPKG